MMNYYHLHIIHYLYRRKHKIHTSIFNFGQQTISNLIKIVLPGEGQ